MYKERKPHIATLACMGLGLALTLSPLSVQAASTANGIEQHQPAQQDKRILKRDLSHGVYEAAYSPKRNILYVATAGEFKDGKGGVIYALDPDTLATKGEIDLPYKSFGLALDDQHGDLYVTYTLDGRVGKVSLDSGKQVGETLLATKKPGDKFYSLNPREVRVDSKNQLVYVTAVGAPGKLFVVDARTMKIFATIPNLGKWTAGLTLDPAHQRAYVSSMDGNIHVINTKNFSRAGDYPAQVTKPTNLAFANGKLYVADQESGDVVVLDPTNGHLQARLNSGKGALALAFANHDKDLFVTNREAGTVTEFNTASNAKVATLELGSNPNSLAIDQAKGIVYVTIKQPLHKPKTPGGSFESSALDAVARLTPQQ